MCFRWYLLGYIPHSFILLRAYYMSGNMIGLGNRLKHGLYFKFILEDFIKSFSLIKTQHAC